MMKTETKAWNGRGRAPALVAAITVAALLSVVGCATENAYMVEGYPEYEENTARLLAGTWTVEALEAEKGSTFGSMSGKQTYIGDAYESGTLRFSYDGGYSAYEFSGDSYPEVEAVFELSDAQVREKEATWREEQPDLQVESIRIIMRGGWQVMDREGDLFMTFDPDQGGSSAVEVDGSPSDAANGFAVAQSAALATALTAQNAGEEGGLLSAVAGAVTEKAVEDAADLADVYPPDLTGVFNWQVDAGSLSMERATASVQASR